LIVKTKQLETSSWNPLAHVYVYKSQVAASLLLLCGSLLSIWVVHRRRYLCLNDSDSAKRRQISKFLKALDAEEGIAFRATPSGEELEQVVNLSGTAQTDIYPVYRKIKKTDSFNETTASWSRIPSLLLVRDDYIALQIGDLVPANCVAVDGKLLTIHAGDRLSCASFGVTADQIVDKLPKGRTTLQDNSEFLLTHCNKLEIFRVTDAPIEEFIRRPPGTFNELDILSNT
jgi:hypothetical protein